MQLAATAAACHGGARGADQGAAPGRRRRAAAVELVRHGLGRHGAGEGSSWHAALPTVRGVDRGEPARRRLVGPRRPPPPSLARQGRRLLHLGLRPGAQDMERWRRAHQERYRATASAQYIFF